VSPKQDIAAEGDGTFGSVNESRYTRFLLLVKVPFGQRGQSAGSLQTFFRTKSRAEVDVNDAEMGKLINGSSLIRRHKSRSGCSSFRY
jgi:hypothetical protein